MTTYFTDFSEYSTGSQPSDWTERWPSHDAGFTVEADAGSTGGQRLEKATATSASTGHGLSWDDIDGDANRDDVEVFLGGVQFDGADTLGEVRAFGRGSVTGASERNMYAGDLDNENNARSILKYVTDTFSELTSESVSVTDVGWNLRFRINGTDLKVRAWEAGTSEPGTWDLTTTDTDHSAAGWVGIFVFSRRAFSVDVFGVGTGGDTAPDSESSGPAAASGSPGDVVDDITAETDWTGAATGITEHELHRSTSSGFTPGASTRVMDSLPTTSASFTLSDGPADSLDPPDPDTTYYYVLRSIDTGGTTDSAEVEVQTAPPRPRLPKEGHNAVAESRMDTDSNGDGVVDGFSDVETGVQSPANPFSVDASVGAQKLEATDTDSGGELGVEYSDIAVSGGEEWNVHVGCKFASLTVNMSGAVLFIWRDSGGSTIRSDVGTELSHTTFQRVTETFTAPANAETLDVRLEMFWDATGQVGTAWFRDIQVIKSGDETGESFTGTVTDEAAGEYVTRFWVDEGLTGTWEIHAEVINDESVDGQNTESPFENLDPNTDVAWKATVVDGTRQSGFSPTRTIQRASAVSPDDMVLTMALEPVTLSGVSLPPIRQKGPSDVLWYADWSQDRDAFVGGAPDYSRGGSQYVRSHKAQGGPLWVPVGGDKIGWGRIAVDGVQAPSRGMVLQPATEVVVDDTADFDSDTAWDRNQVGTESEVESAMAGLSSDGEAREFLGNGTGLLDIRQSAGTFTGSPETLSAILERTGTSDTWGMRIWDTTAGSVVWRIGIDWDTEAISTVAGSGGSATVLESVPRGPNGKKLMRVRLTVAGTAGNGFRVEVFPGPQGGTSSPTDGATVHHIQHEARAYATDPVPGTGSVDTRPKAGCSYTAGPDGSQPFIGYTRFVAMGAPGDFDDFTRVWQVSDALNGTPRAFLRYTGREITNSLTRSEEFDHGDWTTGNITVTADDAAAPDGTPSADTLEDTSSGGDAFIRQTVTVPDDGLDRATSVFLKAGTMSAATVYLDYGGTLIAVEVDLSSGTITGEQGTPASTSISDVGDGWYRVQVVGPNTDDGNTTLRPTIRTGARITGDKSATGTIFAWGAQLEGLSGGKSTLGPYVSTTDSARTLDVGQMDFVLDDGSDTSVATLSPTLPIEPEDMVEVMTAVENQAGDTLIGVRVNGRPVETASAGGPSSGLTPLSGSTIHLNETPQETAVGAHRYHRMVWLPVSALDTPISGHAGRLMDELEHERQPAYGSAA